MNHRIGSYVFGGAVGLLIAWYSYQWITSPERAEERQRQQEAVLLSRALLLERTRLEEPEIVDPLNPVRRVGKTYIYPLDGGWEVSGYYRRDDDDAWHPYLVVIGAEEDVLLIRVSDSDPAFATIAESDPVFEVLP